MSDKREPIAWFEIDVDQCQLTYGQGACNAVLGSTGDAKCFNGFRTCQDKENYDLGVITYTYSMPQSGLPTKVGVFPVLKSISTNSGVVNIAGTDKKLNSLGKRETINVVMHDFPYHDRYTDKYAQERVTGAAQASGVGYDPAARGTHFGKLRARWPYYAGRAARVCEGFIDGGVLTDVVKRHYIITDMDIDVAGNTASFEIKDVLHLASNDSALAPVASGGELLDDISETDTEFTLEPENIGAQYPLSGLAVIGSEIVRFTRAGDVVTLTERAARKTDGSSHSAGATFQVIFSKEQERVDDVLYDLLVNYANVPPAFCPVAKWEAEVTRWASSLRLTVDITKPTGVNKLIGELAVLGLSVWWDSELQEVGLKINRPPDEDVVYELSDGRNILDISIDDRDDERLTQIGFYSVINNPTLSPTDGNSYSRLRQIVDPDAQSENEFNDVKVRQIYTRWLGEGNSSLVRILGKRLINRFRWSPSRYKMTVRHDQPFALTDVLRVNSRIDQDVTGLNQDRLMQVIKIDRVQPKFKSVITAQTYQFDQIYGFITENTRPDYLASSDSQRARGAYFCDNTTLKMSNGDAPFQFI